MSRMVIMIVQQFESLTDCFVKKRAEFASDTRAIIDNDPSNSVRSVAQDMGLSEVFMRWVVYEDIRYFLHKMRKG